jgi:hypothetical protein
MMKRTNPRNLLAVASLIALACACGPERTMLVVRVQSNLAVPSALDTVRLLVRHDSKVIQDVPFPLTGNTRTLPLELGLLSPSGGGMNVDITVVGERADKEVVSEKAITSFVKGKSLVIDMFLAAECVAFDCMDPNKTCTVGQVCIDVQRAASTLPEFVPHVKLDAGGDVKDSGVAGTTGAAGTGAGGVGGAAGEQLDAAKSDASDGPVEVAPEVPACVPKTEDCFNGIDDDCDGKPDCADTECTPTAVCVTRPSGAVGTTVDGTGACPAGFGAGPTQLNGGLTASPTCSGCACGAGTTSCKADLYTQLSQATCGNNTGGKYVYSMSTDDPDPCPIPDTNTTNVYGARLTPWTVTTAGCPASGTPVKPAVGWSKSTKFCAAEKFNANAGNGCGTGQVCMPRGAAGRSCVLLDAAGSCPAGAAADMLYTGFTDTRTCAACSCTKSGASCDNLYVKFGSDYSCGVDYGHIKGGMATCATQTFGIYVPGYQLVGTPVPPTCTPTSLVGGALTPTGARTICCVP